MTEGRFVKVLTIKTIAIIVCAHAASSCAVPKDKEKQLRSERDSVQQQLTDATKQHGCYENVDPQAHMRHFCCSMR